MSKKAFASCSIPFTVYFMPNAIWIDRSEDLAALARA
jgi:hypothetical protein